MRLLADENIPRRLVEDLRARGHEVAWVLECAPGAADPDLLRLAAAEGRTVLTFDKDFGDLTVRASRSSGLGVILLRFIPTSPDDTVAIVSRALSRIGDPAGHLTVVERDRVRLRPLR